MKSLIVKRSVGIAGQKTSISLEDAFWSGLKEIVEVRKTTLSDLIASIDAERREGNLSSCIRVFVLNYYRSRLNQETEARAASPVQRPRSA